MVGYTETTDNWFSAHERGRYCPKSHESLRSPMLFISPLGGTVLNQNKTRHMHNYSRGGLHSAPEKAKNCVYVVLILFPRP